MKFSGNYENDNRYLHFGGVPDSRGALTFDLPMTMGQGFPGKRLISQDSLCVCALLFEAVTKLLLSYYIDQTRGFVCSFLAVSDFLSTMQH